MSEESAARWGELRACLHRRPVDYATLHRVLQTFEEHERGEEMGRALSYAVAQLQGVEPGAEQRVPVQPWHLERCLSLIAQRNQDGAVEREAFSRLRTMQPFCPMLRGLEVFLEWNDELDMVCVPRHWLRQRGLPRAQSEEGIAYESVLVPPGTLYCGAYTEEDDEYWEMRDVGDLLLPQDASPGGHVFAVTDPVVWELDSLVEGVLGELSTTWMLGRGQYDGSSLMEGFRGVPIGWVKLGVRAFEPDLLQTNSYWLAFGEEYELLQCWDMALLRWEEEFEIWGLWAPACERDPLEGSRVLAAVGSEEIWALWFVADRLWG